MAIARGATSCAGSSAAGPSSRGVARWAKVEPAMAETAEETRRSATVNDRGDKPELRIVEGCMVVVSSEQGDGVGRRHALRHVGQSLEGRRMRSATRIRVSPN